MKPDTDLFLLVGNGSFANRGCEAIVAGTVDIVRRRFPAAGFVVGSYYETPNQIDHIDAPGIEFLRLGKPRKYSVGRMLRQVEKGMGLRRWRERDFAPIKPVVPRCLAALSIGGDNYGLDYGGPMKILAEDAYILSKGKPLIIWAASIGRFDADPELEKTVLSHLKSATAIFARESATLNYLDEKGISGNTRLVADPAFALRAAEPPAEIAEEVPKGAVGLNFSALMGKYYSGRLEKWIDDCARALRLVSRRFGRPLLLAPHVTPVNVGMHRDDHQVMAAMLDRSELPHGAAYLLPPWLNAAQMKWAISQCEVFVGARTHSTIAAMTSRVPTASISYSVKSIGLNRDIYGHEDFCLRYSGFSPEALVEMVWSLLNRSEEIREHLRRRIPELEKRAWLAPDYLADVLREFRGATPDGLVSPQRETHHT